MAQFDVVEWMAIRGHVGYRNRVDGYQKIIDSIRKNTAKLGYAAIDEGDEWIATLEAKIYVTIREAQDRYDDWATDPLE